MAPLSCSGSFINGIRGAANFPARIMVTSKVVDTNPAIYETWNKRLYAGA